MARFAARSTPVRPAGRAPSRTGQRAGLGPPQLARLTPLFAEWAALNNADAPPSGEDVYLCPRVILACIALSFETNMSVANAGVPLVETTRSGRVESVHLGAATIVDGHGAVRWSAGDPAVVTFPRSSLKPLQLLALVELGGVERFDLQPDELAVMAGSHGGESIHVERVQRILQKIDAPPEALACGTQKPMNSAAAAQLQSAGGAPSALHNNCSGKHAGMLALARLIGAPLEDYIDPAHPSQRAIREVLLDVVHMEAGDLGVGIDGCSAPAYALPLERMAFAFALLGCSDSAPSPHRAALTTIGNAMRTHPELVAASSGRIDTELMRLNRGLVAKSGAEGYFCVGSADGTGLALKLIDGDAAGRARNLAVAMAVRRAGWIGDADLSGPMEAFAPTIPIHNLAGRYTGEVRAAAVLA
jgi:L-asparaginase II